MLQIDCGANCFQCSKLVVSICKWKLWGLYLVDGLMMFDVPGFVLVLFSFWVGNTWPYITYLVPDHWITCFTFWGVKAHFHLGLLLFFMELVQRLMWISATAYPCLIECFESNFIITDLSKQTRYEIGAPLLQTMWRLRKPSKFERSRILGKHLCRYRDLSFLRRDPVAYLHS